MADIFRLARRSTRVYRYEWSVRSTRKGVATPITTPRRMERRADRFATQKVTVSFFVLFVYFRAPRLAECEWKCDSAIVLERASSRPRATVRVQNRILTGFMAKSFIWLNELCILGGVASYLWSPCLQLSQRAQRFMNKKSLKVLIKIISHSPRVYDNWHTIAARRVAFAVIKSIMLNHPVLAPQCKRRTPAERNQLYFRVDDFQPIFLMRFLRPKLYFDLAVSRV